MSVIYSQTSRLVQSSPKVSHILFESSDSDGPTRDVIRSDDLLLLHSSNCCTCWKKCRYKNKNKKPCISTCCLIVLLIILISVLCVFFVPNFNGSYTIHEGHHYPSRPWYHFYGSHTGTVYEKIVSLDDGASLYPTDSFDGAFSSSILGRTIGLRRMFHSGVKFGWRRSCLQQDGVTVMTEEECGEDWNTIIPVAILYDDDACAPSGRCYKPFETTVPANVRLLYRIEYEEKQVTLSLHNPPVQHDEVSEAIESITFAHSHGMHSSGFVLGPYFGGDEKASCDITILID